MVLGVVGFQSSGFSRGSYLNVGAKWLWNGGGEGLHFGTRVHGAGFISYPDDALFAPEARRFAEMAAARIAELRAAFLTLGSTADCLFDHNEGIPARMRDAAVASALVGRNGRAVQLLHEIEAAAAARPTAFSEGFVRGIRERADALGSKAGRSRFLTETREQVTAARAALKLAPLPQLPW
jgi:hypothetical protein